jgi:hypothetical protein
MVLPGPEFLEGEGVLVARDRSGRIIGFRDPETGRFISRSTALPRMTYDPTSGQIVDSLGNPVGVGAFRLPLGGVVRETKNTLQEWRQLEVDARTFRPAANQEIIERVTVIGRDGKLRTFEISYGLGGKYDPRAPLKGAKWRFETSQALGLAEGERASTSRLREAVAYRDFIIKETSAK